MPSQGMLAQGSLVKVETTTGVYVTVAELTDISFNMTGDEIDASIHNEPGGWRNYLLGPKSAELNITCNYLPSNDTHDYVGTSGLLYHFVQGTKKLWQIAWVGSPTISFGFTGFVRNFNITAPVDGVLQFQSTIRVDGQPTLS